MELEGTWKTREHGENPSNQGRDPTTEFTHYSHIRFPRSLLEHEILEVSALLSDTFELQLIQTPILNADIYIVMLTDHKNLLDF